MSHDPAIRAAADRALACLGLTHEEAERGLALHRRAFVADTFGFLPAAMSRSAVTKLNQLIEAGASADEVVAAKQELGVYSWALDPDCRQACVAGIVAAGVNLISPPVGSELHLHHSLHRMSLYAYTFDALPDVFRKVTSTAAIEEARRDQVLAVLCGANCAPVHGGLTEGHDAHRWIDIYYRFGIRMMHLTYNRRNWIGDGCMENDDAGLSRHGREVIRHLNELGIVVDTPHSGQQTTIDAARCSAAPIVSSHTGCAALYPHPRMKRDDTLQAVADSGGLVGIVALGSFLGPPGGLIRLLDHIDHAVNLIGIDHVAIGTDRAYTAPQPAEPKVASGPRMSPCGSAAWYGAWERVDEVLPDYAADKARGSEDGLEWTNWPYYTVGLKARGYADEDILKILGGNFLRVLGEVEQAAGSRC